MLKIFRNLMVVILIISLVIIADRYTKTWLIRHLAYQETLKILPFLNLTLYFNTGSAFGFLNNASGWQNHLLASFDLIMSFFIVFWVVKIFMQDIWLTAALCLILSGAIGNLYDRCSYGHVIDFLSFHLGNWYFAIFNIADSAIFMGALLLFCRVARQSYAHRKSPNKAD